MTIRLSIPLCANHFAIATKKNRGEQLVGQIGLVMGILSGIGAALGLITYWANNQQGNIVINLFLAAFLGLGCFLIIWTLLTFFVAPLFADPNTKSVRSALKIRHFWPARQELQLEFASEIMAELIARENVERLIRAK